MQETAPITRIPAAEPLTAIIPVADIRRPAGGPGPAVGPEPAPEPAAPPTAPPTEPPPPPSAFTSRSARIWQGLVFGLITVVVLGTCGLLSYRLIEEDRVARDAQAEVAPPEPTAAPRDISSREADPEPLTTDEVFPSDEIVINPAEPPYQVIATDDSADCGAAAADGIAELLVGVGCDQVVRATLRSPDGDYLVSGGIFNLETEDGAEEAYEAITPLIQDGAGRFLGLLAGEGTEPIVLSETALFWDFRGHFLMYAVIARSDGEPLGAADNRHADVISWDLIEVHLRSGVLEARATVPAGPDPVDEADETDETADDAAGEGSD